MDQFKTPILFIIFNRPETTARVFSMIREIKPEKLFIVADGPRVDILSDQEKCTQAREVVAEIDWPCQVFRRFSDQNLGCDANIGGGINWFFENVSEGIILEDDCLPNISFFDFCATMLDRYRDNPRVMHISGDNFLFGSKTIDASYYFSHYAHCWGWATWKRAWKYYDYYLKDYPEFVATGGLDRIIVELQQRKFWHKFFYHAYLGHNKSWDGKWIYAVMRRDGLSIVPQVNLVSNIGFGVGATHTVTLDKSAGVETRPLGEIVHPAIVEPDLVADYLSFKNYFFVPLYKRVKSRLLSLFRSI